MTPPDDPARVAEARAGDRRAFDALTAPHRRALVGHCYRMLGSASDADDAVQESLLRAWRHLDTWEGRASLKGWLYAIATRVCFDLIDRRGARRLPSLDRSAPADPARPPGGPVLDAVWIEPLADAAWCEGDLDETDGPEATVTRRQSVALAFLAAIQVLPAAQRAALLLHDVAGWTAAEIAAALDLSVAAVNSSLQRARATLDAEAPRWNRRRAAAAPRDADTLARYARAWTSADPDALAATLRADAVLAMPPVPAWYAGRDAMVGFFRALTTAMGIRATLVPAPSANGAPTLASYRAAPDGVLRADGLHVLTLDDDGAVAAVMVFLGPDAVRRAGMPETLAG